MLLVFARLPGMNMFPPSCGFAMVASRTQNRIIIIIIDNFCIVLFSSVHKFTVLNNILQHLLSEKKILR